MPVSRKGPESQRPGASRRTVSSRRLSLSAGEKLDLADLLATVKNASSDAAHDGLLTLSIKDRAAASSRDAPPAAVKSVDEVGAFDKQLRLVADDDGAKALTSVTALRAETVRKALEARDAKALEAWLQALVDVPSLRALAIAFCTGGKVTGDASEQLEDDDAAKPAATKEASSSSASAKTATTADAPPDTASAEPPKTVAARALWAFMPSSDSELALEEGDLVEVAVPDDADLATGDPAKLIEAETIDGWLLGRSQRTREVGYFPAAYVSAVSKDDHDDAKTVVTATKDKDEAASAAAAAAAPKEEAEGVAKKTPPTTTTTADEEQQQQQQHKKAPVAASSSLLPTGISAKPKKASRAARPVSMRSLAAFDALAEAGYAVEKLSGVRRQDDAVVRDGDVVTARCTASAWDGGAGVSTPFASTDWDDDAADAKVVPAAGGTTTSLVLRVGDTDGSGATDGLHLALRGLAKGDDVRVTVAPRLAYGDAGLPGLVPPGSHVIYDLAILDIGAALEDGAPLPRGPLPLLARPAKALDEIDSNHGGQKLGRVVSHRKRLTVGAVAGDDADRPGFRPQLATHIETDNDG